MSGELGTNGNLKVARFYQILAGVFGAIVISMLAFFGTRLLNDVDGLRTDIAALRSDVSNLKSDVARYTGEQSREADRLDRTNARQTDMDRRITIIETKMAR